MENSCQKQPKTKKQLNNIIIERGSVKEKEVIVAKIYSNRDPTKRY